MHTAFSTGCVRPPAGASPAHREPPRQRASGGPVLDAAGRPLARAVGHSQDGGLVTGRRRQPALLGLLGGTDVLMAVAGPASAEWWHPATPKRAKDLTPPCGLGTLCS
jgi:hypothetical protein